MTELEKAARMALEALRYLRDQSDCDIDPFRWAQSKANLAISQLNNALAPALAATEHECSRSHPHENMSPMCELRTEIARLRNENTRLKHSTTERKADPVAKFDEIKGRPVLLPDSAMLKHGDLLYTSPQETERKGEPGLFATDVQPQPLRYSLDDYHRAPSEGPLKATWQDKPHRLLYDLVAALAYYTSPQVPEDVQRDADRWRKFSGLDYKVRREWASNLSLVPVLTEWVDALPAIDAARKGE